MAEPLPKYDSPPVIETALSIQFARLPEFSPAMAGWFWKSYLCRLPGGEQWTRAKETARMPDQFERFPDQWGQFGMQISPIGPQRTQIMRANDERLVQIQDSRLILNWQKKAGGYPSFAALFLEFGEIFPTFQRFVADAHVGEIEQNQWEVTYVNNIKKDDLWKTPREWVNVLPSVSFPTTPIESVTPDTLSADWRYVLGNNRGRLYVSLRNAKNSPAEEDFMQLTLTARGPIEADKDWSAKQGFEIGHEAIVRSFTAMTAAAAHRLWKRTR